ncbi:MAG: LicD family protein, partial [Coriobacteriales bacterium]
MNQRQQYLLGLLKEIDTICRRNDISYVLVGGSLIGALRSKG